jgi:ATP-dependent RNA helicase MSS116
VSKITSRPLTQAIAPRTNITSTSALSALSRFQPRLYSTEAATAEATPEVAPQRSTEPVTKFQDLRKLDVHENIVEALVRDFKYEDMTEVQSATINAALKGKDMVAQAKTGTGKTLAFLVPVLQRILEQDPSLASRTSRHRARADDIRAIIMSPTRELAEQIADEAMKLASRTGIVVQRAVGGTRKRQMLQDVQRRGCHLLIATPGRLFDILSDPNSGIDAPRCSALVLDEADRMLDVGFDKELREIVTLLPPRNQVQRQTLLFSATIPKSVISLAKSWVDPHNFEFVQTIKADDEPTHHKVPQHIVAARGLENVFPTILELIDREVTAAKENGGKFKAIVFLPTTLMVQLSYYLFRSLRNNDRWIPLVNQIHSRLSQDQRTRAAQNFKEAESSILLSSDVTARGMDFPGVTHVIQVGTPPNREQYIHRLGRTGRAGREGQGWLIVVEPELHATRKLLPGLPIKRNTELKTPQLDMTNEAVKDGSAEGAKHVATVLKAMETVDPRNLEESYTSLIGHFHKSIHNSAELIETLNNYVTNLGLKEIPFIAPAVARNMGISERDGAKIGHKTPFSDRDRPSSGDRFGGGSRGGRGGYGGRPSNNDDPFSVIRDAGDRPSSGGFQRGGSRGGFSDRNGSRGGYGGRSSGGFGGRSSGGGYGDRSSGGGYNDRSGQRSSYGGSRGRDSAADF